VTRDLKRIGTLKLKPAVRRALARKVGTPLRRKKCGGRRSRKYRIQSQAFGTGSDACDDLCACCCEGEEEGGCCDIAPSELAVVIVFASMEGCECEVTFTAETIGGSFPGWEFSGSETCDISDPCGGTFEVTAFSVEIVDGNGNCIGDCEDSYNFSASVNASGPDCNCTFGPTDGADIGIGECSPVAGGSICTLAINFGFGPADEETGCGSDCTFAGVTGDGET